MAAPLNMSPGRMADALPTFTAGYLVASGVAFGGALGMLAFVLESASGTIYSRAVGMYDEARSGRRFRVR